MKRNIFTLGFLLLTGLAFSADLNVVIVPTEEGTSSGEIDLDVSGGVAPFVYTWTGPDGFSSTDEDLTGLAAGTYAVTVMDHYCGVATMEVEVTNLIDDVSIDDIPVFQLSVYPNPTTGLVYLSSVENIDVIVYNVVGEVILNQKNAKQIDLTGHSAGIYMIQVRSDKGVLTQKITLTN